MKTLITGATGFLGGGLARRLLADGADVEVIVRDAAAPRSRELAAAGAVVRVATDSTDVHAAVEESGANAIAHLATHYLRSHTPSDIAPLARANIEFGTSVLDAAASLGAPVVMASSFFQFRAGAPHPASLYAATKQAFSTIAEYYRAERDLVVRDVVFYDTYGPGDTRDKLVPLLARAATTGETLRLGASQQRINLTYLDDVAAGLIALLREAAPARTTIRAGNPVTVADVVETMRDAGAKNLDVVFNESAPVNDLPLMAGDWPAPPGWEPRVELREGLRRVLAATHP